jgi:hypothetical protein
MKNNMDNEINFEKWALSILAAVIILILGWVGVTVNQNQLQYARIEERLANQSVLLVSLQNSVGDATKWRSKIERDIALIEQRVKSVEHNDR